MMNQAKKINQQLYLVGGTLQHLQVAQTKTELLEKLDQHIRTKKQEITSLPLAALRNFVSKSPSLSFDEGKHAQHFVASLGKQSKRVIYGTLAHADQLQNNDRVRVVVSKQGSVLYTHAIMHADTHQFYMPLRCLDGNWKHFKSGVKQGVWTLILASIFFSCLILGSMIPDGEIRTPFNINNHMLFYIAALLAFIYGFYMGLRKYRHFQANPYAEDIFWVFGLPNPENVVLINLGDVNYGTAYWKHAWQTERDHLRQFSLKATAKVPEVGPLHK